MDGGLGGATRFFSSPDGMWPPMCSASLRSRRCASRWWHWHLPAPRALRWACAVLVLGATAVSEVVSALCMLAFYRRDARSAFAGQKAVRPADPARRLWEILWPVEGGRVLASALHTAENMLVPACLAVYLINAGGRTAALEQYGELKRHGSAAAYVPIWPAGGAFSVLLMPEITQAHIEGQTARLNALLDRMLRLTGYFSALAGAVFWVWGRPLAQLFVPKCGCRVYLKRWLLPCR